MKTDLRRTAIISTLAAAVGGAIGAKRATHADGGKATVRDRLRGATKGALVGAGLGAVGDLAVQNIPTLNRGREGTSAAKSTYLDAAQSPPSSSRLKPDASVGIPGTAPSSKQTPAGQPSDSSLFPGAIIGPSPIFLKGGVDLEQFFSPLTARQPSKAVLQSRVAALTGLPENDVSFTAPRGGGDVITVKNKVFVAVGDWLLDRSPAPGPIQEKEAVRFEGNRIVERKAISELLLDLIPGQKLTLFREMSSREHSFWASNNSTKLKAEGEPGWGYDKPVLHFAINQPGIACEQGTDTVQLDLPKQKLREWIRDGNAMVNETFSMIELAVFPPTWDDLVRRAA